MKFNISASPNSPPKKDTTVCKNSSLVLAASNPSLKQTSAYIASTIPFIDTLPCETTGSVIGGAGINQDDQYSPVQNIGFNFCFYGTQYSQVTICDNGFLTFTLSKAGTNFAPFSAQTLPLAASSTVPPNSILGAMMDVLVATNYSPPGGGTISVQTVGSAPFRAFIVKYTDCKYFATVCRSSSSVRLNMKIVLYETTNMIDVYIKTKPLCNGGTLYNSTQGLVGPSITTQFAVTPGRNNSLWDGANSAVRFLPNGTNYTTSIQWKKNGTVISNTNNANITASDDSAYYVATSTISATCPSTTLTVKDSIKVVGITNVVSNTNIYDTMRCTDSLVLNANLSTVKNYLWDNGSTLPTRTITAAGTYYVVRKFDTLGCNRDSVFFRITKNSKLKIDSFTRIGCFNSQNTGQMKLYISGDTLGTKFGTISNPTSTSNIVTGIGYGSKIFWVRNSGSCADSITIASDSILYNYSKKNNYCVQDSSGMMKLKINAGYSPFTYNLTGRTAQMIDSFTKLTAGIYTISATDNNGCTISKTDTIIPTTNLALSIATDSVKCYGGNMGKITATLTGGVPNYRYSINGGGLVSSGVFPNLTTGTYAIHTTDTVGCQIDTNVTIYSYPQIQATLVETSNCPFNSNGSVTVTASGGKPTYNYLLNTGTYQSSNILTGIINGTYTITIKDALNCTKTFTDTLLPYPKPDLVLGYKKNLSCYTSNNGVIKVVTSSGTPSYSYTWSNNGTTIDSNINLPIGTYTITVNDANNCKDTLQVSLTQPDTIQASLILKNPLCFNQNNGSIKVIASGGTPTYNYSIDGGGFGSLDSFTGLSGTTHTIVIRDTNQCTKTYTRTLINPTKLSASIAMDSVSCFGGNNGRLTLNGIAAKPPYKYSINAGSFSTTNIFNGLTIGTYNLSIQDSNNCQFDTSATVLQYPQINFSISLVDSIRCKSGSDGKISIAASGGKAPYTYSINGGTFQSSNIFSSLNKGTKIIQVKDANNCIRIDSITLQEPSGMSFTRSQTNVKCYSESTGTASVSVTGGTPPYSYTWCNGATTSTIINQPIFNCCVSISDARNCIDTVCFNVTQPDSLSANFNLHHPFCYNSLGSIKTFGAGGVTPYLFSINGSGYFSMDSFSDLSGGTYSISIKDSNQCVKTYSKTLITPPQITATYVVDSVKCYGGNSGKITINASGGFGTLSYRKNSTTQPSNIFNGLISGIYATEIFDANNCKLDSNITVNEFPALTANYNITKVKCYGANTGDITVIASGGAGNLVYAIGTSSYTSSNTFSNLTAGTYTIKVQDRNLCQYNQNIVVNQIDSMIIIIQKTNNLCHGDAKGKIKLSVSAGTAPYLFSFNGNSYSTIDSFVNLTANNYTYSVKDSNGCIQSGVVNISEPTPIVITTTIDSVKCYKVNTGRIQINTSGGTPSYQYSLNNQTYQSSNVFSSLASGAYYLKIRDNNLCIKDTNVVVETSDSFYLNFSVDSLQCYNQNIGKVTINAFGGKPPYLYNIDGGGYTSNPIISGINAGIHTINTKDAFGCLIPVTIELLNPSPIAIQLDSLIHNICNAESLGRIKITSSGGTFPHTYNWSNGNSSNYNTNLAANLYYLTVTDAKNCTKTSNYTITQPSPITFNVNKRDLRCFGDVDAYINTSITGGTSPYSYKWSIDSITPNVSNLIKGTYVLTVTDNNQCKSIRSFAINEPAPLAFNLNQTNSSCAESKNGIVEVANQTGGTPPFTYFWSNNIDGVNRIDKLAPFKNYVLTLTDGNNCSKIDSVYVDTSYVLRVFLDYTKPPKCPRSPLSINLVPTNGSSPYDYKIGTMQNDSGKYHNIPSAVYTVSVLDANNCLYQNLVEMIAKDTLVTNLVNYVPLCETSNVWSSRFYVSGGTKPYTFSWPGAFKVVGDSALHNSKGIYNVTVTDSFNCVVTKQFKLNPPDFALDGNIINKINLRCNNIPEGEMTAYATGGEPPYRYKWSTSDSTDHISKLSANTKYSVTISDINNCNYEVFDTLTQPDSLKVVYKITPQSCRNKNDGAISLKGYGGTAPNNLYEFALDNDRLYQKDNFFMPVSYGIHKIYLKDENQCILEKLVQMDIADTIHLQIDSLYSVSLGNTIALNPKISTPLTGNNFIYQWTPSQGLSCADCLNPEFNGYLSERYTLIVRYGNGCIDSISTLVNIANDTSEFYVPNVFTPNADKAENRVFNAYGVHIAKFKMEIYNRWGEKVFSSDNIVKGWNGNYKGALAPMGEYTYVIEAETLDKKYIKRVSYVLLYY